METTIFSSITVTDIKVDEEDELQEKWESFSSKKLKIKGKLIQVCWEFVPYDGSLRGVDSTRSPEVYIKWLVHIHDNFLCPNKIEFRPKSLPFVSVDGAGVIHAGISEVKLVLVSNGGEVKETVEGLQ